MAAVCSAVFPFIDIDGDMNFIHWFLLYKKQKAPEEMGIFFRQEEKFLFCDQIKLVALLVGEMLIEQSHGFAPSGNVCRALRFTDIPLNIWIPVYVQIFSCERRTIGDTVKDIPDSFLGFSHLLHGST
ncbi:hypothetical protein [Brucella anthropi]|uniref:hypothetical protein n=1 Tax=Brucella anthropi TaxID=529 RepID=UPI00124F23C8|nr:hypothetical protein [Brucella anthropi]KAB2751822.1 hypothetical protein F9L05_01420 [Brucella anthropi]